jgi:CubicO group peptidase (beta-lactamase class C family)
MVDRAPFLRTATVTNVPGMTLEATIANIIHDSISQRIFPGAVVLLAYRGEVRLCAAYGTTRYDDAGSQPVTLDTIYDIASLTKVFTATAALRLYEDGLLALDAPVERYLPEFQPRGITVAHLLTHTSGLDIRLSTLRETGRAGILAAVFNAKQLHSPGSTVAYTNVNSLLLGEIVARLADAPLDRALSTLVLEPLGLRDTCYNPPRSLRPRIAPTELDREWRGELVHGSVHDESTYALGGVAGHAGLFSTAADLYRFCQAWLGQVPLLRPQTIALATTNHTPSLALGCGLGWMIDRPNFMGNSPRGSFGHTGFTGPVLYLEPRQQICLIFLNNRVYPQRQPPIHHRATIALVEAALTYGTL